MPFNLAKFELASGTLLYGEVVEEKRGEARSMRRVMAFHVIGLVTNSIFSVCFLLLTSKTEVLQLPSALQKNRILFETRELPGVALVNISNG